MQSPKIGQFWFSGSYGNPTSVVLTASQLCCCQWIQEEDIFHVQTLLMFLVPARLRTTARLILKHQDALPEHEFQQDSLMIKLGCDRLKTFCKCSLKKIKKTTLQMLSNQTESWWSITSQQHTYLGILSSRPSSNLQPMWLMLCTSIELDCLQDP